MDNEFKIGVGVKVDTSDIQAQLNKKARPTVDVGFNVKTENANKIKDSLKLDKIKLNIDSGAYEAKLADLTAKTSQWTDVNGQARISMDKLTTAYNALMTANTPEALINAEKKFNEEVQKTTNSIRKMNAEFAKDSQVNSLNNKIQAFYTKNTAAHGKYGVNLKAMLKETSSGAVITTQRLKEIEQELINISNQARISGKLGLSFFDKIKQGMSKFSMWFGTTALVMKTIQGFKEMYSSVYKIDTAMTSLYKVTDETNTKYTEFLNNANTKAQELGRSVSSLIDQTASWAKLGYNLTDASKLAETSSIYANVGEIGDEQAVKDIVSDIKAFNIAASDSISIIDKLNILGNKFAVSSGDLGEGLSNSASALSMAGNDISEALAMLTGGTEITQNASEMGNSLKVFSMRIRGMKGKLEELGEEVDNVVPVSKIQTHIANLTNGAVNIFDGNNNFKSTYKILLDISKVYDKLTQTKQADLVETLFGKQRGNQGMALIQAFQSGQVQKALDFANNSDGSAMKEQERWLDSMEAKTQKFGASFEKLSQEIMNSKFLKGLTDAGTGFVNVLSDIIDKFGLLGTTIATVSTIKLFKNFGMGRMFPII